MAITDINGREIWPGDYVAQRSFDDPDRGANKSNMRRVGKVVTTKDLRVGVIFVTWDDTVFYMPGEFLVVVRYVDGVWTSEFGPDEPVTTKGLDPFDLYRGPETSPLYQRESAERTPITMVLEGMGQRRERELGRKVLAVKMQSNGAGAATVKDYLMALLTRLWELGPDFNSKRPFGTSGWENELHEALIRADLISGEINEDNELVTVDREAGEELIALAIKALGEGRG